MWEILQEWQDNHYCQWDRPYEKVQENKAVSERKEIAGSQNTEEQGQTQAMGWICPIMSPASS